MRPFEIVLVFSLLLSWCAVARGAETTTQAPKPTPSVFHSACALGESMAKSLRGSRKAWSKEQAEKTCGILQPKMDSDDAVEFMRCCIQTLTDGAKPAAGGADKT